MSISFIGYVTQEIVVGDRKFITVTLKEDSQNLGEVEVVAIAYGNQDRRMLTSAVSSIDNKELIKSPATSITNILAGALPGYLQYRLPDNRVRMPPPFTYVVSVH